MTRLSITSDQLSVARTCVCVRARARACASVLAGHSEHEEQREKKKKSLQIRRELRGLRSFPANKREMSPAAPQGRSVPMTQPCRTPAGPPLANDGRRHAASTGPEILSRCKISGQEIKGQFRRIPNNTRMHFSCHLQTKLSRGQRSDVFFPLSFSSLVFICLFLVLQAEE